MSIAGGGGKRDVGTQMLELTVWDYANSEDAAKVFREELAGYLRNLPGFKIPSGSSVSFSF